MKNCLKRLTINPKMYVSIMLMICINKIQEIKVEKTKINISKLLRKQAKWMRSE